MGYNRVFHGGNVHWGGWFHPGMRVYWQCLEWTVLNPLELQNETIPEGEIALILNEDEHALEEVLQVLRYSVTVAEVQATKRHDMAVIVPMDSVSFEPPPKKHQWPCGLPEGRTVFWRSYQGVVPSFGVISRRGWDVPPAIVPMVLCSNISLREFYALQFGQQLVIEARVFAGGRLLLLVPMDEITQGVVAQPTA